MAIAAGTDLSLALDLRPVALADYLIVAPVVIQLATGALLVMLRKRVSWHAAIAVAALGITLLAEIGLLLRIAAEGPQVMTMGRWLPPFGITFTADMLGALLAMSSGFVALAGAVHAARAVDPVGRRYGFYPFLLLMMAGVSGTFLTGDIFNLYVWFEILLISSFGLLSLGAHRAQLDGATKYAFLNLVATMLFLITVGLLYAVFGTLNMADIVRKADGLRDTGPLLTLASMFLLAFAMKAAAFPVNFWLPASYHTPHFVTSALFAGLLTKVGIYALLRILVLLLPFEREWLSGLIGWMAILTMLAGILAALAETDLRRLLGFVVISGIGTMLAGLALGTQLAVSGAILYAVHSMLTLTGLYLAAGMLCRRAGSSSLHGIGGAWARDPAFAAAAFLLILGVSGLPPMSGLWPKVMLIQASMQAGSFALAIAILLASLLTMIVLGRVFLLGFWRNEGTFGAQAEGWQGNVALAALIGAALWLGLWPEPAVHLADAAARGLIDGAAYVGAVFPETTP